MKEITQILQSLAVDGTRSSEDLIPLVYQELRRLAAARLAAEPPGQTLQATALVHEAWLRLVVAKDTPAWNSRGHFFGAAAEAMRRILVENARRKKQEKRGGHLQRVALHELRIGVDSPPDELLQLHEMLEELAKLDAQTAELVKLRCFAGLSIEQAAVILGMPSRTAYRDWAYARAWLFKNIEPHARDTED